jgi:putative membrane protein
MGIPVDLVAVVEVSEAVGPQEIGDPMQTPAQKFLTPAEQETISQAVHAAESLTSGEIVPLITSSSYHYPMAAVTGGVLLAFPLSLLLISPVAGFFWLDSQNMWLFLALFLPLYLICWQIVKRIPPLKRFFIPKRQLEEEVREAAMTAFFVEKLYKTKDENGILLFISVFERKVWIIADGGINAKINQNRWQDLVNLITNGIKEGKQAQAICEAIHQAGNILKEHFPIQPDDNNELRDLIIR